MYCMSLRSLNQVKRVERYIPRVRRIQQQSNACCSKQTQQGQQSLPRLQNWGINQQHIAATTTEYECGSCHLLAATIHSNEDEPKGFLCFQPLDHDRLLKNDPYIILSLICIKISELTPPYNLLYS
jgi:hypothetical protein